MAGDRPCWADAHNLGLLCRRGAVERVSERADSIKRPEKGSFESRIGYR
ncbi:hypothetical protein CLOSTMETH_03713 [[Clostridium] methylpentosum DSM 5476]|uniref:Uncharacterized protein n=1 Tax=[Clostridium] methylpentosum DSM 5476 TaxID=537013 RepID=C0EIL8_9FIRM|nr:hypothetical protein CLOSTMETH_03713 [[Clostridium] methylpentosum DSM 5476]